MTRWRRFPTSCEQSSKATSQPTTRPRWADRRCTCGSASKTPTSIYRRPFQVQAADLSPNRFSPHDEGERARFGAYALYRRAAEAVTVRATATALLNNDDNDNQTSVMIVLGDLNDEVEAATTQLRNGPTGSEIGTGGLNQPDHGDRQRLWNLAPHIPEAQRFSRIYRGREELIDHIFVSYALVGKIAQDHVTTDAAGPTPWIDDDPTKRRGAPGSDHRPVLASINV